MTMFFLRSIALGHGEYVDRAVWQRLEGAGIPLALLGAKTVVYVWAGGVAPVNTLVNSLITLPDAHRMTTRCPPNDYRMTTE